VRFRSLNPGKKLVTGTALQVSSQLEAAKPAVELSEASGVGGVARDRFQCCASHSLPRLGKNEPDPAAWVVNRLKDPPDVAGCLVSSQVPTFPSFDTTIVTDANNFHVLDFVLFLEYIESAFYDLNVPLFT
jgi:hypothetical protein